MVVDDLALTDGDHIEVDTRALDRLVAIARAAGRAALVHYDRPMPALKDDRSPVTAADRASHQVIVAGLDAWSPAVPVISEEGRIDWLVLRRLATGSLPVALTLALLHYFPSGQFAQAALLPALSVALIRCASVCRSAFAIGRV